MRYAMPTLVVLLLLAASCINVSENPTLDFTRHQDEELTIDARLRWGTVRIMGAAGFCFYKDENFHYLLTAYHVVMTDSKKPKEHNKRPIVIIAREGDPTGTAPKMIYTQGKTIITDMANDLAIIRIKMKVPVIPLMSLKDWGKMKVGAKLLGAGYPHRTSSLPLLVYGPLVDKDVDVESEEEGDEYEGRLIEVGFAWFGFSGGPVVDAKSGEVVGVIAMIWYRRADRGLVTRLKHVHKLVDDYFIPEKDDK